MPIESERPSCMRNPVLLSEPDKLRKPENESEPFSRETQNNGAGNPVKERRYKKRKLVLPGETRVLRKMPSSSIIMGSLPLP